MKLKQLCLDLLFADACVLCRQTLDGQTDHLLCDFCWAALPRNTRSCRHCARPLPEPGLCGRCQLQPLTAGACIAPLIHDREARLLVHLLKFGGDLRAGVTLAQAMVMAVHRHYAQAAFPDCLVPVPLSYPRQVMRGFNQAAWLARVLSRRLAIPLWQGDLKRRHGPPQRRLTRAGRLRLTSRAFHLTRTVPYAHVAVVDDVLTSGATARALSRQLLSHGASRVDIWCATRAAGE